MATYPSFPQVIGSTLQDIDDIKIEESVNGAVRARAFFTSVKRRVTLMHYLEPADVAVLKQFYRDNRLADSIEVLWKFDCDGESINCIFEAPPQYRDDNPLTSVTVSLREI